MGGTCGLSVVSGSRSDRQVTNLSPGQVKPYGFEPDQAMLNYRSRSFEGYRLLREYFAFPERFRFINFTGLKGALRSVEGQKFHIVVHLSNRSNDLENVIDKSNFLPFCTPAINLFPKRADRININDRDNEFHVIADRSRPMDYEIHHVTEVTGYGTSSGDKKNFLPFYGLKDEHMPKEDAAFYSVQRKPRMLSSKQLARGTRSGYPGQEVFVSLVDSSEAPYSSELGQLGVKTLCSNRDLPMQMPLGQSEGDFMLEESAPVEKVSAISGPTRPAVQETSGDFAWRLISHLSLNYLSLIDENPDEGAAAIRELLQLYSSGNVVGDRQINGILTINAKPVTRRLPIPGPISFGRGLEIVVTLDETGFEAGGMYLFGSVLNEFFSKYVSINHMIETVILSDSNREVGRWAVKTGLRPPL
jgi:type VI secretion system protein ImpG